MQVSFHGIGKVLPADHDDLSPMSPVQTVTHVTGSYPEPPLTPTLSRPGEGGTKRG